MHHPRAGFLVPVDRLVSLRGSAASNSSTVLLSPQPLTRIVHITKEGKLQRNMWVILNPLLTISFSISHTVSLYMTFVSAKMSN